MNKILIVLILVLFSTLAYSGDIPKYALETALSYDGTTEATGNNDGPKVEAFLNYVGLQKGNPYCMSFVVFCYHAGSLKVNKKDVLPKYGRVSLVYETAKKNPIKYKIITPTQLKLGIEKLQPGDISIHTRGGGTDYNFNGHTGITILQNSMLFDAEEGNTSPPKGKAKDEGEGGGVFRKTRHIDKLDGNLGLKGFIRIIE